MAAPEVLWRHTLLDGSVAHCVLAPARPVNFVVWYLNDVVQGVREFEDVEEAREWATTTLRQKNSHARGRSPSVGSVLGGDPRSSRA